MVWSGWRKIMVWSWTGGSSSGAAGWPVSDAAGFPAAVSLGAGSSRSLGAGSSRHFHSLAGVGRVTGGGSGARYPGRGEPAGTAPDQTVLLAAVAGSGVATCGGTTAGGGEETGACALAAVAVPAAAVSGLPVSSRQWTTAPAPRASSARPLTPIAM